MENGERRRENERFRGRGSPEVQEPAVGSRAKLVLAKRCSSVARSFSWKEMANSWAILSASQLFSDWRRSACRISSTTFRDGTAAPSPTSRSSALNGFGVAKKIQDLDGSRTELKAYPTEHVSHDLAAPSQGQSREVRRAHEARVRSTYIGPRGLGGLRHAPISPTGAGAPTIADGQDACKPPTRRSRGLVKCEDAFCFQ